uniref:protein-tyrosine sulfotransferase n=1 Tax=Mycena chlorophos TaxID=658473 RepID=A0ABQ0KYP3_MYCCL|nr:sulfotransferase [Mycena chlorophos]
MDASSADASGIIAAPKKDSAARKLELQRARRKRHPRIDYYPSKEARTVLEAIMRTRRGVEGTWSAVDPHRSQPLSCCASGRRPALRYAHFLSRLCWAAVEKRLAGEIGNATTCALLRRHVHGYHDVPDDFRGVIGVLIGFAILPVCVSADEVVDHFSLWFGTPQGLRLDGDTPDLAASLQRLAIGERLLLRAGALGETGVADADEGGDGKDKRRFHGMILLRGNPGLGYGDELVRNFYTENGPYGSSLVAFLIALLLIRRGDGRLAWVLASLPLAWIAYATNLGLITLALPVLAIAFIFALLPRKQLAVFGAINVAGWMGAYWHSQHIAKSLGAATPFMAGTPQLRFILGGAHSLALNVHWVALVTLLGLAVLLAWHRGIPRFAEALCLMGVGVAVMAAISLSQWVMLNGFNIRYYLMPLELVLSCVAYLLVALLGAGLVVGARAMLAGVAGLSIQLLGPLHGFSSGYGQLMYEPGSSISRAAAQVIGEQQAHFVIGDYWQVWTIVFDALAQAHRSGVGNGQVFGITGRGWVFRHQILKASSGRDWLTALCTAATPQECMQDGKEALQYAATAIQAGDYAAAGQLAEQLVQHQPNSAPAHYVLGLACFETRQLAKALEHSNRAMAIEPSKMEYATLFAQALARAQRYNEAMQVANIAYALVPERATSWDLLGGVYMQCNAHERAQVAFARALAGAPQDPRVLFNAAVSSTFNGKLVHAEQHFDDCLAHQPDYWPAYGLRSRLRRQTPERNHVDSLQALLQQQASNADAQIHLNSALGKEFEDLGDHAQAFAHYSQGKQAARQRVNYAPERESALVDALIQAFPQPIDTRGGYASDEPIFIVGMPRSGTTLVERILSSHPHVHAAGELMNFASQVERIAPQDVSPRLDAQLIAQAHRLDYHRLGLRYVDSTRPQTALKPRFIDKLPHNFLYLGLIAKALPNAKIICLRRHPLDTCLSNFREAFLETSAFHGYSFDLLDIGRFYIQFERIMAHWRKVLPGRIMEVDYETLVAQQEPVTRKLLAHCGLGWHDACLRFEQNTSAVATASTVQVREAMHARAVGRWQQYKPWLQPLEQLLNAAGIAIA